MENIDILNRDEFVCKLLKLVENISLNKSSTCFAINGEWGCGKSFVLDLFQKELEEIESEETGRKKFLVFRYNCWKFDYYEEPLIAIVSSLLSTIEEKTKLFLDDEDKRKLIGMLKAVGISLLSIGANAIKDKTCIDVKKVYNVVKNGLDEGAFEFEKKQEYDMYFGFNKVLNELCFLLSKMTEKYTIIFLVDELDRCIPEYSIKILERLHHLTERQSNLITILAIDKGQLELQVKKIFGIENSKKYLEKFINFEIKLDYGNISEKIIEKYSNYVSLFDKDRFLFDESVEECLQAIFMNIDIRTQEQLVKRAEITHKLLFPEKKDYSFMCMEILTAVMICIYKDDTIFTKKSINLRSFNKVFYIQGQEVQPPFIEFFQKKFSDLDLRYEKNHIHDSYTYCLTSKVNLYGVILFTWYSMHEKNFDTVIQYPVGTEYEKISQNYKELKEFAETINLLS